MRSTHQPSKFTKRLPAATMHLMFYLNEKGERVYTLKKDDVSGAPTNSAHPARFSPDDKFSKERIICKKRFNLLPTQVCRTATQQPVHSFNLLQYNLLMSTGPSASVLKPYLLLFLSLCNCYAYYGSQ